MAKRGRKGRSGLLHSDIGTQEALEKQPSVIEETMTAGVKRRRVMPWWEQAERDGLLSKEHSSAADMYHQAYQRAGMSLTGSNWNFDRVDNSTGNPAGRVDARQALRSATEAAGGPLARSVVWWCVGEAETLQHASERLRGAYGILDRKSLKGALLVALDNLAVYYGLQRDVTETLVMDR